jgi:hypothetical protein
MLNGEQVKEVIEDLEEVFQLVKHDPVLYEARFKIARALHTLKGIDIVNRSRDNW